MTDLRAACEHGRYDECPVITDLYRPCPGGRDITTAIQAQALRSEPIDDEYLITIAADEPLKTSEMHGEVWLVAFDAAIGDTDD